MNLFSIILIGVPTGALLSAGTIGILPDHSHCLAFGISIAAGLLIEIASNHLKGSK